VRERLRDLVGRIHRAADRRQHIPVETVGRLAAVLQVLDADHGSGDPGPADPFETMADVFGLDVTDLDLLLIAAAIDLDANLAIAFSLLRGTPGPSRPSVGLAMELCEIPTVSAGALAHLGTNSPLREQGLVRLSSAEPWLARELSVAERVLGHLVGLHEPDALLRPLLVDPILMNLPGVDLLAGALRHGAGFCWVRSPLGAAGLTLAATAFAQLDLDTVVIDLPVEISGQDMREILRSATREAALLGRGLVVNGADQLAEPAMRWGLAELERAVVPAVAVGTRPWDSTWLRRSPVLVDALAITTADRDHVWRIIGGDPVAGAGLSQLRLTPEAIADAAQHAALHAKAAGVPLDADAVRRSARQLGGAQAAAPPGLGTGSFADLILPPQVMGTLQRFTDWARHRDRLLESTTLFDLGRRSAGLTALFTGSPGTGKTLAAQIVADELGLDLFLVDLPSIVDKYVGETQKNLEKVFHQAESMNVVMFFDEADALFGRRSEVKDAHDRYANQEIAYLLQRLESFDGITILATNLRGNIDQAFSRRMSVIAHFPDPDAETRQRIWESHLRRSGALDPADPIDVQRLAGAIEMAGGDIRNIVLAAAYDATCEGAALGMRHIRAATVGEFHKLGRRVQEGALHAAHS
jgi:hypothetical protein